MNRLSKRLVIALLALVPAWVFALVVFWACFKVVF
jgi:hypothetical protein